MAAAGDIACAASPTTPYTNTCRQQATSDLVAAMDPDVVAPLGDDQYEDGSLSDFQASYGPTWGRFDAISRPIPGNHDYGSGNADGYFGYFGAAAGDPSRGYYAYSKGAWRVYALNTNVDCTVVSCGAGSAQEEWLRADLAAHPAACQLAYWHQPLFNSGNAYLSPRLQASLRVLWDDLRAAGVDVVLGGHDHHYERFSPQDALGNADPDGPREFIVGTGGRSHANPAAAIANSKIRNYDTFGVLRLKLNDGSYDWKFVPQPGKTFTDSGSSSCH